MRFAKPAVVFFIGVILIALGVTKILPGAGGMGGGLCFLGLLLFGFSFIKGPDIPVDAPPPMGPFEQTLGMFYEPTEVFKNLKVHPRWLVAVLLITLASSIYSICFVNRLTSERIISYTSDKLKNSGFLTEDQIEVSKQQQIAASKLPATRVGSVVNTFVAIVALMSFLAAVYLLGALMFGGRINFWQGMAIATHAALPIILIQKLLSLVLLYVKAPEDIHPILNQSTMVQDNLGILFTPSQNPVLFSAASTIGILTIYGLWLTATGIKNGGQGVSSAGGWTIAIVLWCIGLLFAVTLASLFPSFLS